MKRLIAIILFTAVALSAYGSDSLKVFYRIRLDRDIDKSAQRVVVEGLDRALKAHADYILLDLDTYAMWEIRIRFLDREALLEKEMATYSCLENSMDRGAWWATVHGVANSWT